MPNNAATEAARLSTAPMMDGGDCNQISIGCGASCAADVHVPIAGYRAASRELRAHGRDWFLRRISVRTEDETSERLDFSHHQTARPGDPSPFRVFREKVGTAEIWRELRCFFGYFASEAFLARAQAQGLTGIFRYTDFEEIGAA